MSNDGGSINGPCGTAALMGVTKNSARKIFRTEKQIIFHLTCECSALGG